jgi:AcrR family transcriptional regulator
MARPPRPDAHEALLDSARHEFGRVGLERARVEDIARRAGVSKGAFYLHFRTKDDAFREMLQRFLGALEDHARRREVQERVWRDVEGGSAPDRLARVLDAECAEDLALLELMWRHRQITAALDGAGKPYRDLVAALRRKMHGLVVNRLELRQRAGVLRPDLDPHVLGEIVVSCYEDLGRRMADMRDKPDLAAWTRTFLLALYEGILATPAANDAATPATPTPPARRARGA